MTKKKTNSYFKGRLMRMTLLLLLLSLLSSIAPLIPPDDLSIAAFFALLMPLLQFLNILLFFFWLFLYPTRSLVPLISIASGYFFYISNFSFYNPNSDQANDYAIKVMSYNVRIFNAYSPTINQEKNTTLEMIDWIATHEADIKCLQEFYNLDRSEVFNTIKQIALRKNYYFYVNTPEYLRSDKGFFGLIILSKHPIVSAGTIQIAEKARQQAIYADVKINQDTLRIINVHLRSMSIDEEKLTQEIDVEVFTKLRTGAISRAKQIRTLANFILNSPYRVILCGDWNDMPFSYAYQEIKKYLYNSFEYAGIGVGFTYNGRLFFLRIDNQFFSEGVKVHRFETLRDTKYSDHFPVVGTYSIAPINPD